MFRHFSRAVLWRIQPIKRISPSTALTVGVSTTLLCLTNLAVPGRTIRCDSEVDDLLSEDEKDGSGLSDTFRRPRWTNEEYFPSDRIFTSGPTWYPSKRSGVARCDALIVNSNSPSEDSIAVYFPETDDEDDRRAYIGVFDGHNGSSMSDFLCDHLIEYLGRTLAKLPLQYEFHEFPEIYDSTGTNGSIATTDEQDVICDAVKRAFREVDDAVLDVEEVLSSPSKTNAVRTLHYAYSGSCALVSIYEPDNRILRVACTGDSRAVLGRRVRSRDGKDHYEVRALSQDQNAHNPAEAERLRAEHPGEDVVANGRVMGWGMARAFGDATYKWSADIQQRLYAKYLGSRPPANLKTPPYFTAEPEITTTRIKKGDFLIMASDGLWDILTSEEAVGLVGVWLSNNASAVSSRQDFSKQSFVDERVYERDELPLARKDKDKEDKTIMYRYWKAQKRFVNRDDSAAAHLVRNALGGADTDLADALLSITAPRARKYRDDIGVVVTFFS